MPADPRRAIEAVRPYAYKDCAAFVLLEQRMDVELVFESYSSVARWLANELPLSEWPDDAVYLRPPVGAPNGKKSGERVGPWEEWYLSVGAKKESGVYTNGLKTGPWEEFYHTGQVRRSVKYIKGIPDGPETLYHKNGQKAAEWTNRNGIPEGLVQSWFRDGQKAVSATFTDGLAGNDYVHYNLLGMKLSDPPTLPTAEELREKCYGYTAICRA